MNIIFVRHGESEHNAKLNSDKDSGLTKKGRNQVESLGKRLKKYDISAIYTSRLKRAIQTGEIISKILKIPVKKNLEELNEYPSRHLKSKFKSMFKRRSNKRLKRLKKFLKEISKEREKEKTILIVAHGITNRIIMGFLSQIPLRRQLLRFSQENTCMNVLRWKKEYKNWNINCFNDIEHLPIKLRKDKLR